MNALQQLQRQWDQEARTIEAGRRAFLPERPQGEPSMLAGTALVLAIFALLPFIAAVLA